MKDFYDNTVLQLLIYNRNANVIKLSKYSVIFLTKLTWDPPKTNKLKNKKLRNRKLSIYDVTLKLCENCKICEKDFRFVYGGVKILIQNFRNFDFRSSEMIS